METQNTAQQLDYSKYELSELVRMQQEWKQYKADVKASIASQINQADEVLNDISTELLSRLAKLEVSSLKTENGTVSRRVADKFIIADPFQFQQYLEAHPEVAPKILTNSLNQTAIKEYILEDGNEAPAGVVKDSSYVLSIRKPTSK